MSKDDEEAEGGAADQLDQLIHTFCQGAIMERSGEQIWKSCLSTLMPFVSGENPEDPLYMSYAAIMAKSCGEEEEEGEEDDDAEPPSLQEQEIEKMRLLFNQGRLASRGAAEMVLSQISACKGMAGSMIENTLQLGIAILRGGNIDVQTVSAFPFLLVSRVLIVNVSGHAQHLERKERHGFLYLHLWPDELLHSFEPRCF